MNGRFLLDTNIIIALFAKDKMVHNRISVAEEIFISCTAIGELYFGAYGSLKVQENLVRIDEFVINNAVLPCNSDTGKIFGKIKSSLK